MWCRHVEFMLACWLLVSPFVFAGSEAGGTASIVTWAAACVIMLCSLLPYWPPARYANLGTLATGLLATGWAYFCMVSGSGGPQHQNLIVIGITVMMTGVIPSNNLEPPRAWAAYCADDETHRAD